MRKSITEKALIAVAEAVVEPGGCLMLPYGEREQPTVFLKLLHDKGAERACEWIHRQNALEYGCAISCGHNRHRIGCGQTQFRGYRRANRPAQARHRRATL